MALIIASMVPDPIVGTTLGKDYRVIEEIGRGGMAVVYLVEHQTLLKQFAAKVLSAELAANFEARARFTQEAHAASQLDHENIVTISDFGVTSDQRPFFVMELLRGKTLDQRVAEGPMSIEEIAAIAIPVGRALAHAHAEGVVHRDVKPENIFLVQRSQGRFGVKVVDFGIAKAPVHNKKLTKMGQTLGSPMFMAPEACRGDDVDHRADIYSLGILLYLMFCGRVPFEDPSLLKVLQMQVQNPLPPPQSIQPDLAPQIAAVITRALEKDPEHRFPAMIELVDALEEALPPGADRLLIEAQRGSTQAIRTTPFPGVTLPQRTRTGPAGTSESSLPVAVAHPPAPKSNRTLLVVVILCVLFGAGGVVFALKQSGGSSEKAAAGSGGSATPIAAATVDAAAPLPPRKLGPDPVAEQGSGSDAVGSAGPGSAGSAAPVEPVRPAVPAKIELHITSNPAGAIVTLDGNKIGVTPVDTTVDRAERTAQLVLSKRGFADVARTIDLRSELSLEIALVTAAKVATKPTPEPKKPDKPDPKPDKPDKPAKPDKPKGDPNLDIRLSR